MNALKNLYSPLGCRPLDIDQYALVLSPSQRIASLYVTVTAYEYFYKTI